MSESNDPRVPTNAIVEHRLGKLHINREILADLTDAELSRLFGQLFIVRAEYMFVGNYIEYLAFSPLFDVLPEALEPPTCAVIWGEDEEGRRSFSGIYNFTEGM